MGLTDPMHDSTLIITIHTAVQNMHLRVVYNNVGVYVIIFSFLFSIPHSYVNVLLK